MSRFLRMGAGATWPGELALRFNPDILSDFTAGQEVIVLVAGTNGKTTTSKMMREIMEGNGRKVIHNDSGANLVNGLVSAYIKSSNLLGNTRSKYSVFEVDENAFPNVISKVKNQKSKVQIKNQKLIIILLNLFRDQLDRYGEVDSIARKWKESLKQLKSDDLAILNADDPQIAAIGKELQSNVLYFGVDDQKEFLKHNEHATDSTFCPNCGYKLYYEGRYFSHIGIWKCVNCGLGRPEITSVSASSPLPGLYNRYNTFAAYLATKNLGIDEKDIKDILDKFQPAFGRQEEFDVDGKKMKMFLAKNPAGFNANLKTIIDLKAKSILLVLNDRIPDGHDISWIWDVDFETLQPEVNITVSGDRAWDMGLRIKYADLNQNAKIKMPSKISDEILQDKQNDNSKVKIYEELKQAITKALDGLKSGETLYILPTYSAMLDVRKILTGRKIL